MKAKFQFINQIVKILLLFITTTFAFCSKKEIAPRVVTPLPTTTTDPPCGNRPLITMRLVPIGLLSDGRVRLVSAAAGNKILFAGGIKTGWISLSSRVDIYDTSTRTWSTAELSTSTRYKMAVVSLGNKVFFAGGTDYDFMDDWDWGNVTSRVDIYDAVNNTWSTAELSAPRNRLAAVSLGNKVFFAGGKKIGGDATNIVDVYDNTTNAWTTATLSEARFDLSATTVGNKIYFAGGFTGSHSNSRTIDIYDNTTNTWSTSQMEEARGSHTSIAVDNKIFWAGGGNYAYPYAVNYRPLANVEIKDVITGESAISCIIPKYSFNAVTKDGNIIFFTGGRGEKWDSSYDVDIYNTVSKKWSTGVLDKINDATVISVNNTIYVAGGSDGNHKIHNEVWKLEF